MSFRLEYPLVSGRLLVDGNDIYVGNSSSDLSQLALKTDIPTVSQYVHPSEIQCDAASEIESLKSSVSSGKTQVANAITGKGVSASGNDTFATLASKIGQIQVGMSKMQSTFFEPLGEDPFYVIDSVESKSISVSISPTGLYFRKNNETAYSSRKSFSTENGQNGNGSVACIIDNCNYYDRYGYVLLSTDRLGYNPCSDEWITGEFICRIGLSAGNEEDISLNSYNSAFDRSSRKRITVVNFTIPDDMPVAFDSSGVKTGTITITEQFPSNINFHRTPTWEASSYYIPLY